LWSICGEGGVALRSSPSGIDVEPFEDFCIDRRGWAEDLMGATYDHLVPVTMTGAFLSS